MILRVLGCNGPYPAPGGACSGYLVSSDSGETNVLLDMGPGVMGRLFEHLALDRLDALVLSHLHYDHMSDALALQYALQFSSRQNLRVFAPEEPANVRALLKANERMDFSPMESATVGELRLTFCSAVHPVPAFAVAIEGDGRRLVYTGDTNESDAVELFVDGADLLLADAGLLEADWKKRSPHLSSKRCAELKRRARVKRMVLTHLSPRYDPEQVLKEALEVDPGAELAREGEVYYL